MSKGPCDWGIFSKRLRPWQIAGSLVQIAACIPTQVSPSFGKQYNGVWTFNTYMTPTSLIQVVELTAYAIKGHAFELTSLPKKREEKLECYHPCLCNVANVSWRHGNTRKKYHAWWIRSCPEWVDLPKNEEGWQRLWREHLKPKKRWLCQNCGLAVLMEGLYNQSDLNRNPTLEV